MIFRVLGGAALLVGALFGVIAMLVLLPFFSTFSTSLLVLAGVFAVFAYVFLAVGWQLVHPPVQKRGRRSAAFGAMEPDHAEAREAPWPQGGEDADLRASLAAASAHPEEAARESLETEEVFFTSPADRQPEVSLEPETHEPIAVLAPAEPAAPPSATFSGFGEARSLADLVSEPDSPGDRSNGEGSEDEAADGYHSEGRHVFKKPGPAMSERSETRR